MLNHGDGEEWYTKHMLDDRPPLLQLLATKRAIIVAATVVAIPVGIVVLAVQSQKDSSNQAAPIGASSTSSDGISKDGLGTAGGSLPGQSNGDATSSGSADSSADLQSTTNSPGSEAVQSDPPSIWNLFGLLSGGSNKTNKSNSQSQGAQTSSKSSGSSSSAAAGTTKDTTITIPKSATVLTLNGLNLNLTNYVPDQFHGMFNKPPYKIVKVDYPASFKSNSISTGVANLNSMLRSTRGQKIVLAHSQGAQVASRWMREHARDPGAPKPGELTFILTGNPLRSYGPGYIVDRKEVGGTTGSPTPTDTPWPIIDVARRYDGWADWPSNTQNIEAVTNADRGKFTVHPHYDVVNFYDKTHTVWKNGNTTYILTKETTLPLMKGESSLPADVVAVIRARIESAYHRPSNDPKPPLKMPSDPYWSSQMQAWGLTER